MFLISFYKLVEKKVEDFAEILKSNYQLNIKLINMNVFRFIIITIFTSVIGFPATGLSQDSLRWILSENGGIEWDVKNKDSHIDNIEMSGFYISAIVHYGVEAGKLKQNVHLVFPMLRTIPNDTHASLLYLFDNDDIPQISIDGVKVEEFPAAFRIKGKLCYESKTANGVKIRHKLFPSTDRPVFIDKTEVINTTSKPVTVTIPEFVISDTTDADKGVYGSYIIKVAYNKNGSFTLKPDESLDFAIICSGRKLCEEDNYISPDYELKKRETFVNRTFSDLVFESPDKVLNRTFAFAKLRAVESIYRTKGGLMHGPGGGRYYAAIWANDQAEYANPFFPFLGNLAGNESAINSFRHFSRYMNDDFKPIPSSIIAEGTDFWNGAGDRGDMAMIAYGASRFALAYGDVKTARQLWPLIEWSLEYSRRKINSEGVVASDCDELEFRFPAGDANLNTSSLYYDALISASLLGKELGIDKKQSDEYVKESKAIRKAIEDYFGATMDGFETYRYYKGNDLLRAWICTPLTVGIFDRSEGTVDALFSDKLWTKDGLASEEGSTTFWDRATLYALRGVFAAGKTKRAMDYFRYYSSRRLLGEHVPYAVEAYPEGNQRHLSAESALYCRVVTEGVFGIRPEGFNTFSMSPKLPDEWNTMALRRIKAFGRSFDIEVKRENDKISVKVFNKDNLFFNSLIDNGEVVTVRLVEALRE